MRSREIAGYTYSADFYCPSCMGEIALDACMREIAASGAVAEQALTTRAHWSVEGLLDEWAAQVGIDREDERSFDSDDFPKLVFVDQLDGSELCGACGEPLLDDPV